MEEDGNYDDDGNDELQVPPKMKLGAEYEIEASFTNPISKTLTQCEFSFEAPSLQRPIKLFYA